MRKPILGDTMYFVREHFYRVPGHAAPLVEYCVCEGTVCGFFTGKYKEVELTGKNPDGFQTPAYFKMSQIGKTLFFGPEAAAKLAEKKTVEYEKVWNWAGGPQFPMRRSFAHLLQKEER